jgi:hypothetical protein
MTSASRLKGLEGEDDESIDNEGNVTPQLLGQYVYNAIESLPSNERPPHQDPIIITEGSGNIILASYPDRRKPRGTLPTPVEKVKNKYLTSTIVGVGAVSIVVIAILHWPSPLHIPSSPVPAYLPRPAWGMSSYANGTLSGPNGIAVDSAGDVYVADTGNDRIQKFSSAGDFITKWELLVLVVLNWIN